MKKLFIALLLAGVLVSVDAGAATRKACPAGTYSKAGAKSLAECIKCSTVGLNKYTDKEGQSSCKTCPNGEIADESGTGCTLGCKPEKLLVIGSGKGDTLTFSCKDCPTGTICNGTDEFTCKDGYYKKGGSCSKCPTNATCTQTEFTCNAGYEVNSVNNGCTACKAGFYCE